MQKILVLLLITLCSACSSKLAYRYADWMIEREVFSYLDLNRQGRKNLKAQIDLLHHWHQYQELPQYLLLLNQLQGIVEQAEPVTAEQLAALEAAAAPRWRSLIEQASPVFIPVLAQLNAEQKAHLRHKIEAENKNFSDNYDDLSSTERRTRAIKNMQTNVRDYLGKLSPEQKLLIANWGEAVKLDAEIYYADRLAWQKRFFQLMKHNGNAEFSGKLAKLFLYEKENWSQQHQQAQQYSQKLRTALFAQLLNKASSKQKKKLLKNIASYQTLCRDLSSK